MSKFCIELDGMMLPDAIAAVVEAWYEAQNVEKPKTEELIIESKYRIIAMMARHFEAGHLKVGSKMPSIRIISDRIGCHRNTALKIYKQLEKDGAIISKRGSGYYIVDTSKLLMANAF